MRLIASAHLSAAGCSTAEAVARVLAGTVATASRDGYPFAAMPLPGDCWDERLDRLLEHLRAALPDPGDAALYIGSSSWQVGRAETAGLSPAAMPSPERLGEEIADKLGFRGAPQCVNVACVSSLAALELARAELALGKVRKAVVLGFELDNRLTRAGFAALQLLSPDACRPFDRRRNGLMLGEGAAALVLDTAPGKGWRIAGIGAALDLSGPTAADPSGAPVSRAIHAALREAGCVASDIGLIKLHGTGSPMTEAAEAAGLHAVFDPVPSCVSLKSTIGHTLGASGVCELSLLLACLDAGRIPPTAGCSEPDAGLGILPSTRAEDWDGRPVLALWLGFGGQVFAVVLRWSA